MGEDWEATGASSAAMGEAKRFGGFIGVPQKLKACGCRNALVSDAGCTKMRVGGHWRARKRKKAKVMPIACQVESVGIRASHRAARRASGAPTGWRARTLPERLALGCHSKPPGNGRRY